MDFKTVTTNLLANLKQEHISFALIGGFAVSLCGYQRATVDLYPTTNARANSIFCMPFDLRPCQCWSVLN